MTEAIVINGGSDEKGTEKVFDFLTIQAEHQILKYSAGKQIFCPLPKCKAILDYKKTVIITGTDDKPFIMCSKCYESAEVQAILEKNISKIKETIKYRKA